ncbi:MAG: hypothetical protein Q4C88_06735 [Akkermansia sp.]|nr:hypothetical protein [Akkermansia sp.]
MTDEEYTAPTPAWPFQSIPQPNDGMCTHVAAFDSSGFPEEGGATIHTGPLEWGAHGSAPDDANWVEVTEIPCFGISLYAAYETGRLYLKFNESGLGTHGEGSEETNGAGYVGGADDMELPYGTGRDISPDLFIAGLDERDSFLKTPDGRWRAWANWDLLCTALFATGPMESGEYPSTVMTVWVVTVGNVLCFYETEKAFDGKDDVKNWTAYGGLLRAYGADPEDEEAGRRESYANTCLTCGKLVPVTEGAEEEMCGFTAIAPLPWQFDEERAVHDIENDTNFTLGTLGLQSQFDNSEFPLYQGQCVSPGFWFCPRLHLAAARYMARKSSPISREHIDTIFFGTAGDFEVIEGIYHLPRIIPQHTESVIAPGFSLLFDPLCVEACGTYNDDDLAFCRTSASTWLPAVASDWKLVAETTVQGPMGNVYLMIAGAETSDVLLTGSASTELFN